MARIQAQDPPKWTESRPMGPRNGPMAIIQAQEPPNPLAPRSPEWTDLCLKRKSSESYILRSFLPTLRKKGYRNSTHRSTFSSNLPYKRVKFPALTRLIEGWGFKSRNGTPAYKNWGRAPPPPGGFQLHKSNSTSLHLVTILVLSSILIFNLYSLDTDYFISI